MGAKLSRFPVRVDCRAVAVYLRGLGGSRMEALLFSDSPSQGSHQVWNLQWPQRSAPNGAQLCCALERAKQTHQSGRQAAEPNPASDLRKAEAPQRGARENTPFAQTEHLTEAMRT